MSEIDFQKTVLQALENLQGQVSGISTDLKEFREKQEASNAKQEIFNAKQEAFNAKQEIFNAKQEAFNAKQEIFNTKQEAFNAKQEIFNTKQEAFNEKQEASIDALFKLSEQAFSHISDIRSEVVSPWKIRQSHTV